MPDSTPDTSPRCGGTPSAPGAVLAPCPDGRPGCAVAHWKTCPGCGDCAPDTSTGAASARPTVEGALTELRELRARAEAAEAMLAAYGAASRELAALSSDKQTLMTAVTHWRGRTKAAEARYAVAEVARVDGQQLIQRVMKIVGDADGCGIETDDELFVSLARLVTVEAERDRLRAINETLTEALADMLDQYAAFDDDAGWQKRMHDDARAALAAARKEAS